MLLTLAALPSAPDRAAASVGAGARPALVSIVGGWRIFSSQLGLRDDASAGLRLGLGVAPRVVLMTDFTVSGANRSVGTGTATVHALRMLARFDILGGSTRPYVVTGAGGVLFDFNDAQDYATGTLTMGYGLEHRFAGSPRVMLEGDLDLYRNRTIVYSSTGQELRRSPKTTQGLGTIALGLVFGF